MNMFPSVLETVPKIRSQIVNDLDIPEDVAVIPYIWRPPDEIQSDSMGSISTNDEEKTISSESSLALSRAMTDSEIDYGRYRMLRKTSLEILHISREVVDMVNYQPNWKSMLKKRSLSDPWAQMRIALDAFPSGYLESMNSFQESSSESIEEPSFERHLFNEELKLKMERFFEEECRVYSPDDPGLIALEEALRNTELKSLDLDNNIE